MRTGVQIAVFSSVVAAEAATLPPYTQWVVLGTTSTIIAGGVTGATSGAPAVFSSIVNAMAATLDAFTTWVVFSGDDPIAGGTTGSTSGPIYPARTGNPVLTSDLEESATGGFEIVSGTVTPALNAIGVGYVNGEVVTMDGGVIDVGSQTVGTRASIVVDTVDGPGRILTWHVSAGTAGHGDYYFLPTLESPISTTASAAGTGATFTLTQAVTGVSRNGSNELVVEPHRSVGTPSSIVLALPVLHGSDGWWLPNTVGVVVEYGTQTQLAAEINVEKSTYVGVRAERLGTVRGATTFSHSGLHYEGASSWAVFAQRGNDLNQNTDTMTPADIVSGDVRQVDLQLDQSAALASSFVLIGQSHLADSANKITPAAKNQVSSRPVWTLGDSDSEDKDRVFLYLEFLSGLVAGDRQSYTIKSIQAIDSGYSRR